MFMDIKLGNIIKALLFSMALISSPAIADDVNWHQSTESYNIYLGVVPVSLLKKQPALVDGDKKLHGGAGNQSAASQHVMVAIFNKKDNERVLNATVLAEVAKKKLIGKNKVVKPLEKMNTSGKVAYGHFFKMANDTDYTIKVMIYQSDKNGNESVSYKHHNH